jgi:hypothetical protein
MRTKYDIVLRALNRGQRLELPDGFTYVMDGDELCIEVKMWNDATNLLEGVDGEMGWLTCDITLNDFTRLCDRITDEEIAIIAANATLKWGIENKATR